MAIYKTKSFNKWADNAGLLDDDLLQIALEVIQGQVEANLGANLYKKRIALPGNKGKRGGSRILLTLFYSPLKLNITFFIYMVLKKMKKIILAQKSLKP